MVWPPDCPWRVKFSVASSLIACGIVIEHGLQRLPNLPSLCHTLCGFGGGIGSSCMESSVEADGTVEPSFLPESVPVGDEILLSCMASSVKAVGIVEPQHWMMSSQALYSLRDTLRARSNLVPKRGLLEPPAI